MKRALIGVAAAAVLLVGCSDTPAGEPSGATSPSASAPVLGPVSGTQDVLDAAVKKVGCTGFYLGSPPAPAVDAWGPCLLDGKSITFYVVSSAEHEKTFLSLITNLGYEAEQIVKAPSLLVSVEDATQVEQVRKALNGTLAG